MHATVTVTQDPIVYNSTPPTSLSTQHRINQQVLTVTASNIRHPPDPQSEKQPFRNWRTNRCWLY